MANFVVSKELALSTDIRIASWCPTMDLCAVVSSDGQLQLHRMDWQLLWATSPDALITALCWRPDGKQIAIGHANGAIAILDVESGEAVAEHKAAHYAGIHSLSWADQAAAAAVAADAAGTSDTALSLLPAAAGSAATQLNVQPHQRYKRLFAPPILEPHPPSSTEPLPDPYDMCLQAAGVAAWPAERRQASLLTAADVRGRVSLWLQGQVQVAEVAGNVCASSSGSGDDDDGVDDGGGPSLQLLHVAPSSTLDRVLMVNRSSNGAVLVVCKSLQVLQEHQQPLQQCAALFSQLQTYLKAAMKCLEVCSQDWVGALADFNKRFDTALSQELADQGSVITVPQQELVLLLATGSCTPALQSFLSSTLGEANLRRLARSIDATASGLHTALLERLQPLLELVLFLLGELRGCVAAAAAAAAGCGGGHGAVGAAAAGGGLDLQGWMGLQADALRQLELHAAALLLRSEQLRRAVTAVSCQYRAFFSWLLKALRQLEGQDGSQADGTSAGSAGGSDACTPLPACQEVLAFLKGQLVHDAVGPQLSGAALSPVVQHSAEALFYQGISAAETQQLLALLMDWALPPATGSSSNTRQPVQPSQPSPAALDLAADAVRRSLAQQLQHLVTQCEEAFEQPLMVISPSIRPVSQLQLVPAAEQQELGLASPSAVAGSGSSSSSSSQAVAVALPLLEPKHLEDRHTYIACLVPPALTSPAAGAQTGDNDGKQQQMLLLVRLPDAPAAQQQQQQQSCLAAEAVLLQLQPGEAAVAWSCYKEQQLALLLQGPPAAEAGGATHADADADGSCSSTLHLVQLADAPWLQLQAGSGPGSSRSSAAEHCLQQQAVVAICELPHRLRRLQGGMSEQLAVSRARGLVSLVTDMQHLLLLDLEDDDEDDEDEGEGQGEEDMCD